jgi:arsenate reductase
VIPRSLARKALAECIGTALLLIAVVGSGIAAQRLSPGDAGLQLLENALVTGAALVAIILAVGSVSGAHLNPVVSAVDAVLGGLSARDLAAYCAAQVSGAIIGTMVANTMFSLPAITMSSHDRAGGGLLLGEVVATFGLLLVIFGLVRTRRSGSAPVAIGAYIVAAYFFTSSTSFANPAVTVARMFSDSFAGIAPKSVLAFVAAQLVGAGLGLGAVRLLWPTIREVADLVVVPHDPSAEPA